MNLINNPIVRIVGIIIILYFALFYDDNSSRNLKNRLSSEKLKQNFDHIRNKTVFIQENIKNSQNFDNKELTDSNSQNNIYSDLIIGVGDEVKCGSKILIDFIKSGNNQRITDNNSEIIVGEEKFSHYIVGMKKTGKRVITQYEVLNGKKLKFVYEISVVEIINNEHLTNSKCIEDEQ